MGSRTSIWIIWLSLHYLRIHHEIQAFLHRLYAHYLACNSFNRLLVEYAALYALLVPYIRCTIWVIAYSNPMLKKPSFQAILPALQIE